MSFPQISGFCDLNLNNTIYEPFLCRIIEFDYRVIALNYTLDVTSCKVNVDKRRRTNDTNSGLVIFPESLSNSRQKLISKSKNKLKVFLRITVIFSDAEQLKLVFNAAHFKKYDLVAVVPTNDRAYEFACGDHYIDLISFKSGISNYKPTRRSHKQLLKRNGFFEISYVQAMKSNQQRQDTFTMAQYIHIYGKSKNCIISSGAKHPMELRTPLDVVSVGLLFGLSEEQSKCSISHNCKMLLLTAWGRKYGKVAITVKIDDHEEPSAKRCKLSSPKKDVNDITNDISVLTT